MPYVRTVDNFADFFTKPIVGHNFFRMRDVIMNCVTPGHPRQPAAQWHSARYRSEGWPHRRLPWCRASGPWRGLPPARGHTPPPIIAGVRSRLLGWSPSTMRVIGTTHAPLLPRHAVGVLCLLAPRSLGILLRRMGGRSDASSRSHITL